MSLEFMILDPDIQRDDCFMFVDVFSKKIGAGATHRLLSPDG